MVTVEVDAGDRVIEVSNADRVIFPGSGVDDRGANARGPDGDITKAQLVWYYRAIAPVMLPHVRERPLVMQRFPEGIARQGFYEKRIPAWFPAWIPRVEVPLRRGGTIAHPVVDDAASLAFIAEQSCITFHAWLSRTDDVQRPDRLIFDLDPVGDDPVAVYPLVRWAARELRVLLEGYDLPTFVTTTGSRGLHVVVPLKPELEFDDVRKVARALADRLAKQYPDDLTTAIRKDQRGDALFLDVLCNGYGQTAVAPYTVRARPGAPVATPLDWEELGRAGMHAQRYTLTNIHRRLAQREDPWREIDAHAVSLLPVQAALARR